MLFPFSLFSLCFALFSHSSLYLSVFSCHPLFLISLYRPFHSLTHFLCLFPLFVFYFISSSSFSLCLSMLFHLFYALFFFFSFCVGLSTCFPLYIPPFIYSYSHYNPLFLSLSLSIGHSTPSLIHWSSPAALTLLLPPATALQVIAFWWGSRGAFDFQVRSVSRWMEVLWPASPVIPLSLFQVP